MAKPCMTCARPEAEAAILAGSPYSAVSKRFKISDDALRRHMKEHLAKGVTAAGVANVDEWRRMAGKLYEALAPWPEARQAAADVLANYDGVDD